MGRTFGSWVVVVGAIQAAVALAALSPSTHLTQESALVFKTTSPTFALFLDTPLTDAAAVEASVTVSTPADPSNPATLSSVVLVTGTTWELTVTVAPPYAATTTITIDDGEGVATVTLEAAVATLTRSEGFTTRFPVVAITLTTPDALPGLTADAFTVAPLSAAVNLTASFPTVHTLEVTLAKPLASAPDEITVAFPSASTLLSQAFQPVFLTIAYDPPRAEVSTSRGLSTAEHTVPFVAVFSSAVTGLTADVWNITATVPVQVDVSVSNSFIAALVTLSPSHAAGSVTASIKDWPSGVTPPVPAPAPVTVLYQPPEAALSAAPTSTHPILTFTASFSSSVSDVTAAAFQVSSSATATATAVNVVSPTEAEVSVTLLSPLMPSTVTVSLPAAAGEISPRNAAAPGPVETMYTPPIVTVFPRGTSAPSLVFDVVSTLPMTGLTPASFVVDTAVAVGPVTLTAVNDTAWELAFTLLPTLDTAGAVYPATLSLVDDGALDPPPAAFTPLTTVHTPPVPSFVAPPATFSTRELQLNVALSSPATGLNATHVLVSGAAANVSVEAAGPMTYTVVLVMAGVEAAQLSVSIVGGAMTPPNTPAAGVQVAYQPAVVTLTTASQHTNTRPLSFTATSTVPLSGVTTAAFAVDATVGTSSSVVSSPDGLTHVLSMDFAAPTVAASITVALQEAVGLVPPPVAVTPAALTVHYDALPPLVAAAAVSPRFAKAGDTVLYNITFTDAVASAELVLSTNGLVLSAGLNAARTAATFSFIVAQGATEGVVVAALSAQDAAGNVAESVLADVDVVLDLTPPTVERLERVGSSQQFVAPGSVVVFNVDVTGGTVSDFTVSDFPVTPVSGTVFHVTIPESARGNAVATVSATDDAGNTATLTGLSFTVGVLTALTTNVTTHWGAPLTVHLLTTPALALPCASTLTATNANVTGTSPSCVVTPASPAQVSIDVGADAVPPVSAPSNAIAFEYVVPLASQLPATVITQDGTVTFPGPEFEQGFPAAWALALSVAYAVSPPNAASVTPDGVLSGLLPGASAVVTLTVTDNDRLAHQQASTVVFAAFTALPTVVANGFAVSPATCTVGVPCDFEVGFAAGTLGATLAVVLSQGGVATTILTLPGNATSFTWLPPASQPLASTYTLRVEALLSTGDTVVSASIPLAVVDTSVTWAAAEPDCGEECTAVDAPRQVVCLSISPDGGAVVVDDGVCLAVPEVAARQPPATAPCPCTPAEATLWWSPWSACSPTCGTNGTQTRSVACFLLGVEVELSECEGVAATEQACVPTGGDCETPAFAVSTSELVPCTAACGGGVTSTLFTCSSLSSPGSVGLFGVDCAWPEGAPGGSPNAVYVDTAACNTQACSGVEVILHSSVVQSCQPPPGADPCDPAITWTQTVSQSCEAAATGAALPIDACGVDSAVVVEVCPAAASPLYAPLCLAPLGAWLQATPSFSDDWECLGSAPRCDAQDTVQVVWGTLDGSVPTCSGERCPALAPVSVPCRLTACGSAPSLACPNGCSGHGTCDLSAQECACEDGFSGEACQLTAACTGVVWGEGERCCESGVLTPGGGGTPQRCCSSPQAILDSGGACCETGILTPCGNCAASAGEEWVDASGECCPAGAFPDAAGLCCTHADGVDACGVCGGSLSTCGTVFDLEAELGEGQPCATLDSDLAPWLRAALGVDAVADVQSCSAGSAATVSVTTSGPAFGEAATLGGTSLPPNVTSMTVVGVPLPTSVCGNSVCETGEVDSCNQDCLVTPVAVTCPNACSGAGTCVPAVNGTAACSCVTGVTGLGCSLCAPGFVRTPGGGCGAVFYSAAGMPVTGLGGNIVTPVVSPAATSSNSTSYVVVGVVVAVGIVVAAFLLRRRRASRLDKKDDSLDGSPESGKAASTTAPNTPDNDSPGGVTSPDIVMKMMMEVQTPAVAAEGKVDDDTSGDEGGDGMGLGGEVTVDVAPAAGCAPVEGSEGSAAESTVEAEAESVSESETDMESVCRRAEQFADTFTPAIDVLGFTSSGIEALNLASPLVVLDSETPLGRSTPAPGDSATVWTPGSPTAATAATPPSTKQAPPAPPSQYRTTTFNVSGVIVDQQRPHSVAVGRRQDASFLGFGSPPLRMVRKPAPATPQSSPDDSDVSVMSLTPREPRKSAVPMLPSLLGSAAPRRVPADPAMPRPAVAPMVAGPPVVAGAGERRPRHSQISKVLANGGIGTPDVLRRKSASKPASPVPTNLSPTPAEFVAAAEERGQKVGWVGGPAPAVAADEEGDVQAVASKVEVLVKRIDGKEESLGVRKRGLSSYVPRRLPLGENQRVAGAAARHRTVGTLGEPTAL